MADVVVVENTRGGARNPLDKQRSCKDHTDFVYRKLLLLRGYVYIYAYISDGKSLYYRCLFDIYIRICIYH